MAPPTPDDIAGRVFRTGFRGFDQDEVRAYLRDVAETVRALTEERERLLAELGAAAGRDLAAELDAVTAEVGEVLQAARAAAESIRQQALSDAHQWRTAAAAEVEAERARAGEEAEGLRAEAAVRATEETEQARRQAGEILAAAEQQALKLVGDGEREAHRFQANARREADDLVRSARTEAERLLADAQLRHDDIIATAQRLVETTQERARALEARRDELRREVEEMRRLLGTVDEPPEAEAPGTEPSPVPVPAEEPSPTPWEPGGTVRVVRPSGEARRADVRPGIPVVPDEEPEIRVITPDELARRRSGEFPAEPDDDLVDTVAPIDALDESSPPGESGPPVDASVSGEAVPEETVPAGAAPVEEPPAEAVPEEAVPGAAAPVEEPLEEAVPEEAVPEEAGLAAGAAAPVEEAPEAEAPDVSGLFARLRSPAAEPPGDSGRPAGAGPSGDDRGEAAEPAAGDIAEEEGEPHGETEPALLGVDPFELRDRLVLPVGNRALRNLKRQLTDQQNAALEEVRLDESGWEPAQEPLAAALRADLVVLMSESYAAGHGAAEEILGTRIKRPSTPRFEVALPFAAALVEDLVAVLRDGRASGQGGRQLAAGVSRVFRGWRTDEAERRVRDWSFEAYHLGLVDALREAGHHDLRWVVAGRGCASCRAAGEEPAHTLPPQHPGCGCTLVPA